ncbi:MAG: protein translocase SEC61 complex subunit gamma [Candidatus Diapherotrites archaeon]
MFNLSPFIESSRRIFTVARKPDREEFMVMIKATGLGILLVAVIGYIMKLIFTFISMGFPKI